MDSQQVFIVLDNLRVGGIQRLALDEAYGLRRNGRDVSLIVLEEEEVPLDDIREIDGLYFEQFKLNIIFVPKGKLKQVIWFFNFTRLRKPKIVFCHSAKGIGLARIASLALRKKLYIVGFLHQLATLSSTKQRLKRMLFFSMANQIRASSKQFILELDAVYGERSIVKKYMNKKLCFDRMGVDLARIDWLQVSQNLISVVDKPALIFNSRVTDWKGFRTFLDLARNLGNDFQYILITSRMVHQSELIADFAQLPTAKVYHGKSVAHFLWTVPALHIYPTNYGKRVKFQQNIGLNVLECLALGIPSVISSEGFETWPELRNSKGIFLTDWVMQDISNSIKDLFKSSLVLQPSTNNSFRRLISIEQHLNLIVNLLK